jgi:hypothetical protein
MQDGGGGAAAIGFLIGAIIGMAIFALIGAIILRAAISLYNRMTSNSVPEPSFGSAYLIVFAAGIVNAIVQFAMGFMLGMTGAAGGDDTTTGNVIVQLIGIPVSLVVMAAMISSMLPTTFGRAFLITLLYLLIGIAIGIIIALIFVAIMFATGAGR